ncbi:MAG: rRNA maturation RNase YbeY [Chitinophagaceae bacterium]|nr:rRNA maturation RNase YbeY [Chitinophagaceae bacterium]
MGKISFLNADVKFHLANKKETILFIKKLFEIEGFKLKSLNYIFCSDEYLLNINNDFLKHDFYTDIITFDLSKADDKVIGEVYISIERVNDNAHKLKVSNLIELRRVIIHGALHLCGYKDKKKSEITLMREKEDYFLRLFENDFTTLAQI